MIRFYLILLGIIFFPVITVYAQYSRVEVRINKLYSGAVAGNTDNTIEHTWKFLAKDNTTSNFTTNLCFARNTSNSVTRIWFDINEEYVIKTYYSNTVPNNLTFKLRGYEDDVDRRCDEDGRDDQGEEDEKTYYLEDFPPGIWSRVIDDLGTSKYKVVFQIRYTPIPPTVQSITPSDGLICTDEITTLTPAIAIENTTGLTYQWQYYIVGDDSPNPNYEYCIEDCYSELNQCIASGGPCNTYYNCFNQCPLSYPPIPNWHDLGSSDGSFSFTPAAMFAAGITYNTSVQFRVRAVGPETSTAYGPASDMRVFSPPAPTSTASPIAEPSCTESNTGIITLDNITKAFSTYRYILKRGDVSSLGCDPQRQNCLTDVERSGESSGSRLVLTNIPVGTYSLFLLNPGGVSGVCPRRIGVEPIEVRAVPNLNVYLNYPGHIACHDSNTGSISLTIAGGRPNNVSYDLFNQTTTQSWSNSTTVPDATVTFNGLSPGSYRLTTNDGCTPLVTQTFEITQPIKVSEAEFQPGRAFCNTPGDGAFAVTSTRSEGNFSVFSYQLYRDGILLGERESAEPSLTWNNLPPAENYRLIAKERGALECNGYVKEFAIQGPEALNVENINISSVTCNGGTDGRLTLTGSGGSGLYEFELTSPAGNPITNTSGEFNGLRAATYTITVKNAIAGCTDQYTYPVTQTITQPTAIAAAVTKTDISCHGVVDGSLHATITGGTPGSIIDYNYQWEMLTGNTWTPMSTTNATPIVGEGDYRLRVLDGNSCEALSNQVSVIEPDPVVINNVVVNDIRCFGDYGTLNVIASGGTLPYIFEYTLGEASTYTIFTSSTPLPANSYKVRMTDRNGCSQSHPGNHIITAPPSALNFSYIQSNFNGFNISCFGGANGSITITPEGGNGNAYTGYHYAVNDNDFQTSPLLENINAGTHAIRVRDARGCVLSKDVLFTQTTDRLEPNLVHKQDVVCFGDRTGTLEILASGGLAPYHFSIDESAQQLSGTFTNLPVGEYVITIVDKNNCAANYTTQIESINPAMHIEPVIKHVSCFGGNDATITPQLTGGVSPFTYQWIETGATTSSASNLVAGTYTLRITDNAGCVMEAPATVTQPETTLTTSLITIPVCYGRTTGSITVSAGGGTSPYSYSLNDQNYQSSPQFINLGVGTYTVTVSDINNCKTSVNTTVIQRNDRPEPNFVVAIQRNALDTLVITDISIPKPDSITWQFSTAASIIDNNPWMPRIKFSQEGTYTVTMTGYFGGCDYSITKNLMVSPHDPTAYQEKLPGYRPIESVEVSPNPTTGEFDISVMLNKKYNLTILVYDMIGITHYDHHWEGVQEINRHHIVLDKAASGIYLIRVITDFDARDIRLVINK